MSVDPKRVQAVFLAAVETTDPAQQAALLDRECASDPELRRRVEALLQAHRDPASILDRPAVAPPPTASGPLAAAEQGPSFSGQVGPWAVTAHVDPSAGRDGPKGADDRGGLGFLEPPTQPGALGRIGHYEVLEVLGHGGFGIVLRAQDEVLQRAVAVKVLAPQMAATSPARKRFLREARSYAKIRHENVVQVHAVEEQPLPYLVMEFIPGETLQQRLDRTGPLDVPEILSIGRQIAEGLTAAHETGLIHRDVKPANVLIEAGPHPRVKLTDFGLARAADDASITQSGLVAGTPLYMAPEQARGETLDHRADLFSLGSVLYVMCTGRPPFRASTPLAILKRVCEDTPRPIREVIPETPLWLCDLITRLHAKDPAARFQSVREVADLLRRYQDELTTHGKVVPAPVRPARAKRPRGLLLAAAAVALIGVLVFALLRWSPLGSDEPRNGSPQAAPWRPRPPLTREALARLSSPFDALDRKDLPGDAIAWTFGGRDKAPPELVALLDGSPSRFPRPGRTSGFAEDRAGKWLAVGIEAEVVLFDPRTMKPVKVFGSASGPICQLAFSPDGKRLATASRWAEDGAAVWDVEKGKQIFRLKQKGDCLSIQYSPDGDRLLTVGEDHKPTVWDANSGEELRKLPAQDQPVCYDVTFSADGKQIVTHAAEGAVKVWNAQTWDEVITLPGPERVTENLAEWRHLPLAVSPDGKWLAAGSRSGFKIWATDTWKVQCERDTLATWLAFAPDGRSLLTGSHEGWWRPWHTVARWDTQTGRRLKGEPLGSRGPWAVYHLSTDGKTLYGMACDPAEPSFHVYDADTLEERFLPGHAGRVRAVDVSPDGAWIASAGADGTVRLWDVATRRLLHTVRRPGKTAVQAVFSADGKTLFGAWHEDGVILAIDPANGRWRELGVYGPKLQRLAVAPDGALLAAAGDGGVRLWTLPEGMPRGELPGAPPSPAAVAFSPDAKTLTVGGAGAVRLFDAAQGRPPRTLKFPGAVRWVGFRPDGLSIAAAGESPDNPVLLFDVETGTQTERLQGDEAALVSGAWRADGGLLAAAGPPDGTVRLWDFGPAVPRRRAVAVFEPNAHGIEAVALAPEGRHLVTANSDGTITILRLAKAGAVSRAP
jgi:serine/threonine protein kinase/WD40 repeat protein